MSGLAEYLWRLLPGNPILLRVVETAGKRLRDLFARCGYLGLLIVIVIWWIFSALGDASGGDLSKLNIVSQDIFSALSQVQLFLIALLAPMFTAGAITQEKDSQTYDILLSTPLTNGQIVLGSLASRLFFIFTLLLSGIPVFSITQVFGGVAIGDIVLSTLIAAATALVTGSLAIAIATFKVGTRRTIFSFYMFNAVYLVGLYLLDKASFVRIPLADGSGSLISYFTPIHPFLALNTILDPVHYGAPTISQLPAHLQVWPIGFALTKPAQFFIVMQVLLSIIMVLPSIVFMRRIAQSTTSIKQLLLRILPARLAGKTRPARTVWNNPIAWREAKTKASAARATITRLLFVLLGVGAAIALLIGYSTESAKPQRWLDYGSYSASSSVVTIRENGTATTYLVTPNSKFEEKTTKQGEKNISLPFQRLNERWEVLTVLPTSKTPTGAKEIGTIVVRPVARMISLIDARKYLLGLVLLEVSVILVTVTMASASTVTREKEDGTLDLLLGTPITSRYYLWGKLRGLVSNVLPLM
ncbi:MAG TPA: ABC transporter permease subunit, partial [Tepidisphaeraceae bacterium]|nr:ABC transporter permease subunit [Tepidisphaeraceae bacterium]